MLAFLRRLFGICSHSWRFERMRMLNEFTPVVEDEEEFDNWTAREFKMYRCMKCHKTMFSRWYVHCK